MTALWRLWLLGIVTSIQCASLMVLSTILCPVYCCGQFDQLLWTCHSVVHISAFCNSIIVIIIVLTSSSLSLSSSKLYLSFSQFSAWSWCYVFYVRHHKLCFFGLFDGYASWCFQLRNKSANFLGIKSHLSKSRLVFHKDVS